MLFYFFDKTKFFCNFVPKDKVVGVNFLWFPSVSFFPLSLSTTMQLLSDSHCEDKWKGLYC